MKPNKPNGRNFQLLVNPYPGNWGGWGKNTPSAEWDSCFCDIVTDPLGFPTQPSVSLYLLPFLRGRFDYNVHVTGFCDYQHCTPMKLRRKLHGCDIFGMSDTENGKIIRQECKQRYLYIFKMTDKNGSSNRSSSRAESQPQIIQPNKYEVSITVILAR